MEAPMRRPRWVACMIAVCEIIYITVHLGWSARDIGNAGIVPIPSLCEETPFSE